MDACRMTASLASGAELAAARYVWDSQRTVSGRWTARGPVWTLAASDEANPVSQEVMHMAPWRAVAQREWGTTASWIKGDGQYAVLHPCGGELTVTLCATPAQA